MFSESWVGMEFHSYPAFLFMKSAAPNTPNKNQNTPKEIFFTPRVFGNNLHKFELTQTIK